MHGNFRLLNLSNDTIITTTQFRQIKIIPIRSFLKQLRNSLITMLCNIFNFLLRNSYIYVT